jgi:hypothetical protein
MMIVLQCEREETDSMAEAGIAQTFFYPKLVLPEKKRKRWLLPKFKSLVGGSNIHTASAFLSGQ